MLVAPAGIEPTARGLGNRCSIQLSYGAITRVDGPTVPRRVPGVNAEARFLDTSRPPAVERPASQTDRGGAT